MLIKSFLTEQAKQARHRSEAQHQEALDLEHRAQQLRRSAADNEAVAEELDRLAGQYADVFDPAEYSEKGAAGTEVQHADSDQDDEKIRFAWLERWECSEEQRSQAVGTDDTGRTPKWAIPEDCLEPGQLIGRTLCEL